MEQAFRFVRWWGPFITIPVGLGVGGLLARYDITVGLITTVVIIVPLGWLLGWAIYDKGWMSSIYWMNEYIVVCHENSHGDRCFGRFTSYDKAQEYARTQLWPCEAKHTVLVLKRP